MNRKNLIAPKRRATALLNGNSHGTLKTMCYGWLEVMCKRCETRASIPLDAVRGARDTPMRIPMKATDLETGNGIPPSVT